MATPKEQHEARHGRVTATDWERRRELELAREREHALEHGAETAPPGEENGAGKATADDAQASAPVGTKMTGPRAGAPPVV